LGSQVKKHLIWSSLETELLGMDHIPVAQGSHEAWGQVVVDQQAHGEGQAV
jgi:hypothetical protein